MKLAEISMAVMIVTLLTPLPSMAQEFGPIDPSELTLQSSPIDPDAEAVVLQWSVTRNDPESNETEYYRIKIFNDAGTDHANIELPYLRGHSRIIRLKARTIQPDGTVIPFDGETYDRTIVKSGRYRLLAKTFALPGVSPGSIIEYRFTRAWDSSIVYNTSWILHGELPVVRATLRIYPYVGYEFNPQLLTTDLPAGAAPESTPDGAWSFELSNLPRFNQEPFSPTAEQASPRIDVFYDSRKASSPEKFWQAEASAWARSIEDFIRPSRGVKSKVAAMPPAGTAEETLRGLYEETSRIRNLSYSSEVADRDNRSVDDVLASGRGYANEINRLFVALARAGGFDARVVRVAPRDRVFFRKEWLASEQLDGEIAVVHLDSQDRYFDPGTPGAPFGLLAWQHSTTQGLKISSDSGPAEWIWTPDQPATHAVIRRAALLNFAEEGLSGKITVSFEGQEALQRRLEMLGEDQAAIRKIVEDEILGWLPADSRVSISSIDGHEGPGDSLVIEGELEIRNHASSAGARTFLPTSIFSMKRKNPFLAETRVNPVYFDYEHTTEDHVTINLPDGMTIETLPQPKFSDLRTLRMRSYWTREERALWFSRNVAVKALLFEPSQYPKIREFFSAVQRADQEAVVLSSTER